MVLAITPIVFLAGYFFSNYQGNPYKLGIDKHKFTCLPWRLYVWKSADIGPVYRGEIVVFSAKGMGPWFKDGDTIAKIVAAKPGDKVEVKNDQLFINGKKWDRLHLFATLKKPKGSFDRIIPINQGQYLVLGTTPNSFDGRYWGTIDENQIKGRAWGIM